MNFENWSNFYKEEWRRKSNDFLVSVVHSTYETIYEGNVHNWNVYAYVYSKHPLFDELKEIDKHSYYSNSHVHDELHGGCTFFEKHTYDGKITSIQYGSDYSHLCDERFKKYASKEDAYEVFHDADKLFNHLAELQNSLNLFEDYEII